MIGKFFIDWKYWINYKW